MLDAYVVHADLSAYNILYQDGEIRIIDLPQAVDALEHSQAFELFERDMHHVCKYFARQGVDVDAEGMTHDLWSRRMDG
jgi:RIO kinase 1